MYKLLDNVDFYSAEEVEERFSNESAIAEKERALAAEKVLQENIDKEQARAEAAEDLLDKAISEAIRAGYSTFISGMARGVDIWAAEIVLKYRDAGAPIKLICASPFEGFETSWKAEWQNRYNAIMKKAF